MLITRKRFDQIIAQFKDKRILVVGDIYLDETNFGRITEMSLEAPIPVFEKTRQYHNPGAAGNVAANIAAMGGQASLVGIVGADTNADILRRELDPRGIDGSGIVVDPDNPTNTYGKYRAGGETYPEQEILRSDTPRLSELSEHLEAQVIESIQKIAPNMDAVIVIDQVSYLITPKIVSAITDAAREHDLLTVADSRERIGMIKDVDMVVPNESELGVGMNLPVESDEALKAATAAVLKQSRVAFITRGASGISVFAEGTSSDVPTFATEVVDVTGAGDTVTASATLSVLSAGALQEAAEIANAAAANAVRQLGAVTVTTTEIEDTLFGTGMSQAVVSGDTLKELVQRYQAAGKKVVWTNGCFDILHAGHVTYLMSAAKEGDVLVVGLNSDKSVTSVKGPERPIVPEAERALIIGALGCVDHVIVFDDDDTTGLLERYQPDVYAKGGDYTLDTINQDERKLVESYGGRIALIPGVDGRSTTNIIQKLTS